MGLRGWVTRSPVTTAVALVTALAGLAQLATPAVVEALQRDRVAFLGGEWWRLVTPLLVQPSGPGQYAYNLLGIVLVGVAAERVFGRARWLLLYLTGGIAGVALIMVVEPLDLGGGSSDAVAGLIGAVVIAMWRRGELPPWPGYLYAAHFAVYLTVLDVAGVVPAALAGTVAVAAAAGLRRAGRGALSEAALGVMVVVGAVVMTALGDSHGIGLLTGLLLGLVVLPGRSRV